MLRGVDFILGSLGDFEKFKIGVIESDLYLRYITLSAILRAIKAGEDRSQLRELTSNPQTF